MSNSVMFIALDTKKLFNRQYQITNSNHLENILSRSPFSHPFNLDQIEKLTFEHCEKDCPDNDYIEWSLNSDYLIDKAKQFRREIDLYKTYDNHHHLITKLLNIISMNISLKKDIYFSRRKTPY